MSRTFLYFTLATLPVLIQPEHPPADAWAWFRLGGSALVAGLLAVKAYQSQSPEAPEEDKPGPANVDPKR